MYSKEEQITYPDLYRIIKRIWKGRVRPLVLPLADLDRVILTRIEVEMYNPGMVIEVRKDLKRRVVEVYKIDE